MRLGAMHIAEGENTDRHDARRVYVNFNKGTVIASLSNHATQQTYRVLSIPGVHGPEYGFIVGATDDAWGIHAVLSAYTVRDQKRVEVAIIFVAPEYRNLGYGRTLLEEARKYIPADKLLTSSLNIGVMAVRNWCSVARKHKEIYLSDSSGKKMLADFSGPMPVITKGNKKVRMDQGSEDYFFVWPKT